MEGERMADQLFRYKDKQIVALQEEMDSLKAKLSLLSTELDGVRVERDAAVARAEKAEKALHQARMEWCEAIKRAEQAEAALTERTQERDALAAALKTLRDDRLDEALDVEGMRADDYHTWLRREGFDAVADALFATDYDDILKAWSAGNNAAQQAIGAKEWREKYESLARTHALLGHDCDTSGQCDADCGKCAEQRKAGALSALKLREQCKKCRGTGMVSGPVSYFETDSKDEIRDAELMARRPCPECGTSRIEKGEVTP